MMKRAIRYVILPALMLALLTACEHKELCYETSHGVRVVFDWSQAAAAGEVDDAQTPPVEAMALVLFPEGGTQNTNYALTPLGGNIEPAVGRYEALCLNIENSSWNPAFEYRNPGRRETFEVTTGDEPEWAYGFRALGIREETMPVAEGTEDEPVRTRPDSLYTGCLPSPFPLGDVQDDTLTLSVRQSFATYTVIVEQVENCTAGTALTATLSGLAGGLYPGLGPEAVTDERVRMAFGLAPSDGTQTELRGSFLAFGAAEGAAQRLVVYAVLLDGQKWFAEYDVSEKVAKAVAEDPHNVEIRVGPLRLPEVIGNGSGFQPTVDDWQRVEIPLEL